MADAWSAGALICPARSCHAPAAPTLPVALDRYWASSDPARAPCGCDRAANMDLALRVRQNMCGRSDHNQEIDIADLAAALGVTRGVFLEMGGHDGLANTNTRYLESCLRWRGALIEADDRAFAALRRNRPTTLAVRVAACRTHGKLEMLRRNSLKATEVDATTAFTDRPGTSSDRAHSWMKNQSSNVERTHVPCGPLTSYLRLLRTQRVDAFFLDIEGAELLTLQTVDWCSIDIGLLIVEFSAEAKQNNKRIHELLTNQGFELVSCVTIWRNHIYNLVYLRAAHFGFGPPHELPPAALEWIGERRHGAPASTFDRCPRINGSAFARAPPAAVVARS